MNMFIRKKTNSLIRPIQADTVRRTDGREKMRFNRFRQLQNSVYFFARYNLAKIMQQLSSKPLT